MPQPAIRVNSPRTKTTRKISFFEEHVFHQWLTNVWAGHLTPSEYKVLSAVFARTVAWGKMWELIPTRHLQHGIPHSDGKTLHFAGTGLSRPTIFKALERLSSEGYILRRAVGQSRRYAVNLSVMGTASDPAYTREAARVETRAMADALRMAQRAAIVAAEAHYRATRTQEARDAWMALLGPVREDNNVVQLPIRRRTRCSEVSENTCETEGNDSETGKETLPIKKEHKPSANPSLRSVLPEASPVATLPGRRQGKTNKPEEHEVPTTGWRQRTRRVRREVAIDVVNRPVIEFALRHGDDLPAESTADRVHARLSGAPGAGTGTAIDDVLNAAVHAMAAKRSKRLAKAVVKVEDLEQAWSNAIASKCGGYRPPVWTPKERGMIKHRIKSIELPDKAMRWGYLFDWVARDFGTATALAIPFMLSNPDKRESILDARPSLSLLTHFATQYVEAYALAFHGGGHTPEDEERARLDRNRHDRAMERLTETHAVGYDNLSTRNMRPDELEELVQRLAQNDEEAQAVLEARDENRELARRLRRAYGTGYRQVLQTRIAQEQVRQARMAQRDDDTLPPTEDLSGYMGED